MIWYILDNLKECILNILNALKPNGLFIIQNIFLLEQQYGKELFYGETGLKEYIMKIFTNNEITFIDMLVNEKTDKYWGCLIFQKNNLI